MKKLIGIGIVLFLTSCAGPSFEPYVSYYDDGTVVHTVAVRKEFCNGFVEIHYKNGLGVSVVQKINKNQLVGKPITGGFNVVEKTDTVYLYEDIDVYEYDPNVNYEETHETSILK